MSGKMSFLFNYILRLRNSQIVVAKEVKMARQGHKESELGLISASELAQLLGVRRNWVYRATELGIIPSYRFGRYLKYSPEEVLEATRRIRRIDGDKM